MLYTRSLNFLIHAVTVTVLVCGFQLHFVKALGDADNPYDPAVRTSPGSGEEFISWTNQAPTSGTVSPGDVIAADLALGGLDPTIHYVVLVGKTEGERPGGWDISQQSGVCVDLQDGVNTATYGARTIAIGHAYGVGDKTFGRQGVDTTRTLPAGSQYRLWAILLDEDFSGVPCTDKIVKWSAKGFNGAADVSGGGGGNGNTGGNVHVTTTPANFTTADVGNGGNVGTTDASAGNITALTSAATNPANAFCNAMTIRLPGNGGNIELGKAGILGICNTRPLLINTINILLILAGIFFVGSVIYSGIMLVQASSDDVAVRAKKNLTWSAIGAIIVILSNWVVPFIIGIITASLT